MLQLFNQISSNMMRQQDRKWACKECTYTSNHKGHVFEHVESKHTTNHPGYQCTYCGEVMYYKGALRKHKCVLKPINADSSFVGLEIYKTIMASIN